MGHEPVRWISRKRGRETEFKTTEHSTLPGSLADFEWDEPDVIEFGLHASRAGWVAHHLPDKTFITTQPDMEL